MSSSNGSKPDVEILPNPLLSQQIAKLHQLEVWRRWLSMLLMWLTLGSWSLWDVRESIVILREYFSWPGILYGFYFHLGGGCGLLFCLLSTCSSLLWQISHSAGQLSAKERYQLEVRVRQIQARGQDNWLWRWIN